jgi:hypothetical protein
MPSVVVYVSDLAAAQAVADKLGYSSKDIRLGMRISTATQGFEAPADVLTARGLAAKNVSEDPSPGRDKQWNEATLVYDTVIPPKGKILTDDFLGRFTPAEREDFLDLRKTQTGTILKRVEAFINYLQTVQFVDLDDQYVIDSINGLEGAPTNVLAAGRAAEILADPRG